MAVDTGSVAALDELSARAHEPVAEGGVAPADPSPEPRAIFALPHAAVEIWCVSDLLEHLPDTGSYQSSTEQKASRLPLIVGAKPPDLVIAVGTAAFPDASQNNNGGVVIGTRVFMHDGHPGNPASQWAGPFDTLLPSLLTVEEFRTLTSIAGDVHPRLLPTPHAPWGQRAVLATYAGVAIGNMNVTDYTEYTATDARALAAYGARDAAGKRLFPDPAGSLETTHGVIRATVGGRFLFVSGIVDRVGHLDDDVGASEYGQNFVGAHNAGVAVAWMLPAIDLVEDARRRRARARDAGDVRT